MSLFPYIFDFSVPGGACPKTHYLTDWAHRAPCEAHSTIICFGACLMLLFHGLKASLPGFVVKQTCFLKWFLTYKGPLFFFLWSLRGIDYLITYFVPISRRGEWRAFQWILAFSVARWKMFRYLLHTNVYILNYWIVHLKMTMNKFCYQILTTNFFKNFNVNLYL